MNPVPACPPPPGTYADLYAHFGDPRQAGFEAAHIVPVAVEIAGGKVVHVRCHKLIAAKVAAVFADLKASGQRDLVQTYDGCFVVRTIRGSSHPSLHSWGLALDVNAAQFPLGSHHLQNLALTATFMAHGFFAGENFHHRKDPMHYEYTNGAI